MKERRRIKVKDRWGSHRSFEGTHRSETSQQHCVFLYPELSHGEPRTHRSGTSQHTVYFYIQS